jgi:phosphatidylserine decarboxylase
MSQKMPYRVGQWLPSDHATMTRWLKKMIDDVDQKKEEKKASMGLRDMTYRAEDHFHPVIAEFKEFIENNADMYMLFTQMFSQVPHKPPYDKDPSGKPQVRDYRHMLELLNNILTTAPEYERDGLVGFPINAILDWPMGTISGYAAFLNKEVNAQIKMVLDAWGKFLQSPDSAYVLNTDKHHGWFGEDAMEDMPNFVENFKCDPSKEHHGFTSWDNFFTREFRDGRRPVASPKDDSVIVNACESAPFMLAKNVKKVDRFWIKGQPYSLSHMMANDPLVDGFVGGTIYQAFLSALSYHRWHSPVSGRIVKAYNVEGTYYSETLDEGFNTQPDIFWNSQDGQKMISINILAHGPDPYAPNNSQGYITEVAARALIFIEADNPDIGLMCFMAVGMSEVSSCEITVKVGQKVKKGEQLGMFHFGGSTHCLIFRPEVNIEFDLKQSPGLNAINIPLSEKIATVKKSKH